METASLIILAIRRVQQIERRDFCQRVPTFDGVFYETEGSVQVIWLLYFVELLPGLFRPVLKDNELKF